MNSSKCFKTCLAIRKPTSQFLLQLAYKPELSLFGNKMTDYHLWYATNQDDH